MLFYSYPELQFGMFETVVTSVVDQLRGPIALSHRGKMVLVLALCGIFFLLGLPFCLHACHFIRFMSTCIPYITYQYSIPLLQNGYYLLLLVDSYCASFTVLLIGLVECLAIGWIYRMKVAYYTKIQQICQALYSYFVKNNYQQLLPLIIGDRVFTWRLNMRFDTHWEAMLGSRLHPVLLLFIKYITPATLIVRIIHTYYNDYSENGFLYIIYRFLNQINLRLKYCTIQYTAVLYYLHSLFAVRAGQHSAGIQFTRRSARVRCVGGPYRLADCALECARHPNRSLLRSVAHFISSRRLTSQRSIDWRQRDDRVRNSYHRTSCFEDASLYSRATINLNGPHRIASYVP